MGINATSPDIVEGCLERLAAGKKAWIETGVRARIACLEQCLEGVERVAQRWVQLSCQAKGIPEGSPLAGEEWMLGPIITARTLRLLTAALKAGGQPRPTYRRRRIDGRTTLGVFPVDRWERLLWPGVSAELWIQPGKPDSQGLVYRTPSQTGRVCLVLGAGNAGAIPPTDVLSKLFAEDQVVLLKMNPVNDYLGPLIEDAFYPLVRDGFLAVIYGGADLGSAACRHPAVDTIHVTGSRNTHDAIVWGDQESRTKPTLNKPITSELGCVTPVLVVPGPWSAAQIRYQARHLAGMIWWNAGFNCVSAQLLVTSRDWPLRQPLLDALASELKRLPRRKAYYPGAAERHRSFREAYGVDTAVGEGDCLPPTLIRDVKVDPDQMAFQTEAFCGVLAETALEATDPEDFLARATELVNQNVWGNLSCNLLVHPDTERAHEVAVARCLRDLAYGTVAVNLWSGVCFGLATPPWGAYPGNTLQEVSSGIGVVHNAWLYDHPEKTIVRAPFTTPYLPPWFPNHRCLDEVGQRLFEFELRPGPTALLKALYTSVKSSYMSRY